MISPERSALAALRTPLEPGERLVLEFFDSELSSDWEIYVQPFLNGCRPDFVLLNPKVGVAVFEVKNWNLEAVTYRAAGEPGLLVGRTADGSTFLKPSPLADAERYAEEIRNIYCPALAEPAMLPAVTRGVIFTSAPGTSLTPLFEPELSRLSANARRYVRIAGRDLLGPGRVRDIFPEATRSRSKLMSEELAADLRSWLAEPVHAAEQRTPPPLDARQRELVESRTATGYRRVRGPAGSGKTTVVAGRAARLADEGKRVLVVSFNHTFRQYLADLVVRFGASRRAVVWLGFHEWCKRTIHEAGRGSEYRAIFKKPHVDVVGLDHVLDADLPELAQDAIMKGPFRDRVARYDAILVDEGQDFLPGWWACLRSVLAPGGEMLLVADRAQDIYERNDVWTEQAMKGAGFTGPWTDLTVGYRMPERLHRLTAEFANQFELDHVAGVAPPRPQQELSLCRLEWQQVADAAVVDEMVETFNRLFWGGANVGVTDVCFVSDTEAIGKSLVGALEGLDIKTATTFGEDAATERRAKYAFFKGAERIKVTTIHSFKGWESAALIVAVTTAEPALVYTALTRLHNAPGGSHLHVVCSQQRFASFGASWGAEGASEGQEGTA